MAGRGAHVAIGRALCGEPPPAGLRPRTSQRAGAFLAEPVLSACLEWPDWLDLGSTWPDLVTGVFHPAKAPRHLRPDGAVDVDAVLARLQSAEGGPDGASCRLLAEWRILQRQGWIEGHTACGPDFYAREMARAIAGGDGRLMAFLAGVIAHLAEYLAHFKSAGMLFLEPTPGEPLRVYKGQPFFRFGILCGGSGDEPAAADVRSILSAARPRTARGADFFPAMFRRHLAETFPAGLALQRAIVERRAGRPEGERLRALMTECLADMVGLAASAVEWALAGADDPERPVDVLLLVRGDFWRRYAMRRAHLGVRLPPCRLRVLSLLERAGLSWQVVSGEAWQQTPPLAAHILVLDEWRFGDETAFYAWLRARAGQGTRVTIMGDGPPGPDPAETSLRDELARAEGVSHQATWRGLAEALRDSFGPCRVRPDLARTPAALADDLTALRQADEQALRRLSDGQLLRRMVELGQRMT